MITYSLPCPRCGHEKSILRTVWADQANANNGNTIPREVLVQCVHCTLHSILVVKAPGNFHLHGQSTYTGDSSKWAQLQVMEILPAPTRGDAPEDVPEKVGKAFSEGMAILTRKMWTPAAGSFRTSLDRATQVLWDDLDIDDKMPFKLEVRLRSLREKMFIPLPMMEWADTVRVVGNEMHELDDVSQEDAEDAAHFVETFLTYMFTLPQRVARFKARREAEA